MSRGIPAGKAFVEVGLRSKIAAGAKVIQRQMIAVGAGLRSVGTSIAAAGAGISAAMASVLVVPGQLAADAEITQASFTALLGSAERAAEMLSSLRKFAAETPFGFKGISESAKTLMQYGVSADGVLPALQLLGDVSLGNQERLDGLAIAFGQVRAKGRLMAQELNQMIERGFSPLQEIARTSGRDMQDLYKAMERGEVTFDMVVDSFRSATSAGGNFFGAMELASKTFTGQMTALGDEVSQALLPIGQMVIDVAKPFVAGMRSVVSIVKDYVTNNPAMVRGFVEATAAATALGLALTGLGTAMLVAGAGFAGMAVLLGGPMTAGIVAASGAVAAFLYQSGQIGPSVDKAREVLGQLGAELGTVFGAVSEAIGKQRPDLAVDVMIAGLKKAYTVGFADLKQAIVAGASMLDLSQYLPGRADGRQSMFGGMFGGGGQAGGSRPQGGMVDFVKDSLTMLNNVIADNLFGGLGRREVSAATSFADGSSPQELIAVGKATEQLEQAVQAVKDAAKPEPTKPAANAADPLKTGQGAKSNEQMEKFAAMSVALEREIDALNGVAGAAEKSEMALAGFNEEQRKDIEQLIDRRERLKKEIEQRKKLEQEGKQLSEAVRTPLEVLQDTLRRNTELERAGAINATVRDRADRKALDEFNREQQTGQGGAARNSIAERGTAEALATIRRSLGLVSSREWTQQLVANAGQQLAATVQNTEAVSRLSERAFNLSVLEQLGRDQVKATGQVVTGVDAVAKAVRGNAATVVRIG